MLNLIIGTRNRKLEMTYEGSMILLMGLYGDLSITLGDL